MQHSTHNFMWKCGMVEKSMRRVKIKGTIYELTQKE